LGNYELGRRRLWLFKLHGLWCRDSVSKVLGNSKPEPTKSHSVYAWYGHWYDCTFSSVNHSVVYIDYDDYVTPSDKFQL
jgi:hypothetical protein